MNLKWDYVLKNGQLSNPILYVESTVKDINFTFNEEEIKTVMNGKGHQLKTWGGSPSTSAPHWIGVRKQTPLHTDPRYPRYTHHLVVYVDNFCLRGLDKEETPVFKNQYIVIDTHSPHQLLALGKNEGYYIAASMDSYEVLDREKTINALRNFINNSTITNNTERITK